MKKEKNQSWRYWVFFYKLKEKFEFFVSKVKEGKQSWYRVRWKFSGTESAIKNAFILWSLFVPGNASNVTGVSETEKM